MKREGFREEWGGAEGEVGKEPDSTLSRGLGLVPVVTGSLETRIL